MISNRLYSAISQAFSQQIPGLEVEIRFGTLTGNGRVVNGLPWASYYRALTFFGREGGGGEEITMTDYIDGDIRHRVGPTEEWVWKSRLWDDYVTDYALKVSVSREEPIEPPANFEPRTIRSKKRTSFPLYGGTMRADFTEVGDKYELELELLTLPSLNQLNSVISVILKQLDDTLTVYSQTEKRDLISWVNRILGGRGSIIDPSRLTQARDLKIDDLVYGGVVGNPDNAYTLTHKVDGVRKLLIINKTGIWLALADQVNLVSRQYIRELEGTILDGELVPPDRRYPGAPTSPLWYIPYDSLAQAAPTGVTTAIQQQPHVKRLNYAQAVSDYFKRAGGKVLAINTKSFKTVTTAEEFFTLYRELSAQQLTTGSDSTLSYKTDGLILTPTNAPYLNGSAALPLKDRILSRVPDVCKIKPIDLLTVDLLFSEGQLYAVNRGELVPFTGNRSFPLMGFEANVPDGTIVEFSYREGKLVEYRLRPDKRSPNTLEVALDIWYNFHHPISSQLLSGNTFDLVRRYHNRLKRQLLSMGQGTLLDIGSGKGGDVSKWGDYSHIYAVEPTHVEELRERAKKLGDRVTIIQARGQDTDLIARQVDRVDTIALMNSLSFFWKDSDTLDGLIRTIKRFLKPGGKILFLAIDGDLVDQTFRPLHGPEINQLQLGPAKLVYQPPSLYIDIPGTIVVEQTEWPARLDDLYLRLGYPYVGARRADGERFLTQAESLFSQLFSYGIISSSEMSYIPQFPNIIEREEYQMPAIQEVAIPASPSPVCKIPGPINPDIGTSELPAIPVVKKGDRGVGDDTYLPINFDQPYEPQLVRIGTIGDNSCFFHAILKAYYKPYAANPSWSYRTDFVRKLRDDLATALQVINPDTGRMYYYDANDGVWEALSKSVRIDDLGNGVDYSLQGMQRLLRSNRDVGDEVFSYVTDMLGLDLYVLKLDSDRVRPIIAIDKGRPAVVIGGNGYHYETIGALHRDVIQTVFWPSDPLIGVLQCMFRRTGHKDT